MLGFIVLPMVFHDFGGGGGANAGVSNAPSGDSVVYPTYLEEWHKIVLYGGVTGTPPVPVDTPNLSVTEAMNAASSAEGGNPYDYATAYDPATDLENASNRVDEFGIQVGNLDPGMSLSDALQFAVDNTPLSDATIATAQTLVDLADTNSALQFRREVARVSAGLFDIGGVMTTQFHQTMANMEHQRRLTVGIQQAEILNHAYDVHVQKLFTVMEKYLQQGRTGTDAYRVLAELSMNLAKLNIAARQDQIEFDLEHLIKRQTWDLELFGYGSGVFSSITGAQMIPRPQTRRERLAGGVVTSISAGLQAAYTSENPWVGLITGLATLAATMLRMS